MTHQDGHFEGVGGNDIYWQSWLPDRAPRAIVALAHGASEHSGRYAWTAEQLTARGYGVYALDHRGHGRSSGSRALVDRMANVVADLGTLIERAAGEHPERGRPFLLGHSMGGGVALAYATRHQETLEGLIVSAPLAVLEAASPLQRIAGRVLSAIAPKAGVYDIDSSTVSRDPEVVRDYDSDPLNHHGKLPARTVAELSNEVERFPAAIPALKLPLLVLVGTGDQLVPPRASDFVYEMASSDDKTIKRYDGLYHEILNEPERETVVADIADWLDARTSSEGAAAPPQYP
ncbi:MAG: alpha/beta hydrolase [Thermoleophilaceae bacterium]